MKMLDKIRKNPVRTKIICFSTPAHAVTDSFGVGLAVLLAMRFGKDSAYGEVGVLLAIFAFATAVSEPLWGRLSDKTGRRAEVVGWGLVMGSLSFAAIGYMGSPTALGKTALMCAAFLCGVGAGSYHGVATALLNEYSEPRNRGLLLGINNAGGSLGRTLAPMAITLVAGAAGSIGASTLPFLACGCIIGGAFISLRRLPRSVTRVHRGARVPTADILRSPLVVRLAAFSILRTSFFLTSCNLLPTFLIAKMGMDPVPMGILTSAVMATGVIAQPLGGAISDRMDRRVLIGVLLLGSSLCYSAFLAGGPGVLPYVLLSIYIFLVLMSLPLVFAVMGDGVPHDRLGLVAGVVSGAGQMGAALTQVLAGEAAQRFGPTPALLGVALLGVLAGAVAFAIPKHEKGAA